MFDLISDILSALGKNKLRTFLTGFSMAWGILMLVILLGCGNGLKNAMLSNYESSSSNRIQVWPGRTSMPYKGLQAGRRTIIDAETVEYLKKELPQIVSISPTRMVWGVTETYGAEYISGGGIYGVTPEYYSTLENFSIIKGRIINELDDRLMRKVIIVHKRNADNLFKGADPIGKYLVVNNVPYKVVGIYIDDSRDSNPADIVPLGTLENIYPSNDGYGSLKITVSGIRNKQQSEQFEQQLRECFARKLDYDPNDRSGVWLWNEASSYFETLNIMNGISAFLWLIGLGTLIAGIVGISNIMLVTVKERTKEFGIRKALGARPRNIISLILTESLMITAMFGYLGMLLGIMLLELLSKFFPAPDPLAGRWEPSVFVNPSIDLGVAVGAMAILVLAGLAAAYVPAKRAVDVKPIEALHYEK